jgi:hypothetical protein
MYYLKGFKKWNIDWGWVSSFLPPIGSDNMPFFELNYGYFVVIVPCFSGVSVFYIESYAVYNESNEFNQSINQWTTVNHWNSVVDM